MSTTQTTPEKTTVTPEENKKGIENHKKIASHFEAAAKSHLDAAKHHEAGEHEKAAKSTVEAHGHNSHAIDGQREDTKQHATKK
jgi:hypothetical protein